MRRLVWRALSSVRVRVTTTALLAVAVALGAALAVLDVRLQHDRQRVLLATAEEQARQIVAFNPRLAMPLSLPADTNLETGLVQVLREGRVLGASRALRHLPPLWRPGDPEVASAGEAVGDLARDVRVVTVPVTIGGATAEVVVVTSLDQYDHTVADVQRLLEIGTPMLLAVVGLICWLTVGRALRPIELMRREVARVAESGSRQSHFRVAEPGNDDEVGRLARTLNSMLARMHASTERERRFVSDASHELRSPLANIRTELEVALHHPEATDWREVASDVLGQNERMEGLVAGLLLLARSDEGSLIESAEPVDVAAVVEEVVDALRSRGRAEIVVDAAPVSVRVPPVYLERMITNLVDNALRFAVSRVEVLVEAQGLCAVLKVSDDGPGVPVGDRSRIFERFVRLDEARGRGSGGFGLGLAIVADLSRHYGGSIRLAAGSRTEFVLTLPLAAPAYRPSALGAAG